ncbi:hypothetical protein GCM10010912_42670 [Paenibacillus albidus]|uniref:Uncharacterized protein n=1 Tax=Paenibacillus albidus TaxID=2041023 RepID=A0A917FPD2_9BACL|nr:hypothetical protein GCM10010912_42670 [Paenibacillus albidus]
MARFVKIMLICMFLTSGLTPVRAEAAVDKQVKMQKKCLSPAMAQLQADLKKALD